MKKLTYILVSFLLAGSVLTSCMKVKEEAISDTEMLIASAMIDMNYEIDFSTGMDQSAQNSSYHSSVPADVGTPPSCATITVTTAQGGAFPRTFRIDFGSGCEYNGFNRSGVLIITLSDYFMSPGSEMLIERENYVVNGWEIDGDVTFVNQTTDANEPSWKRSTTNASFTSPVGVSYTHYGDRTVKQIGGFGNTDLEDNIYEISSGMHHITRWDGNTLEITIVAPVVKAMSCDFISEGIMKIDGGLLNGNIDYGNGDCDNEARYTHHNGLTFNMNL